MAITKLQAEALNLADTYAFTGTVTGAGGVNTPAFLARLSSGHAVATGTWTKINVNTEVYDTAGTYDNSIMLMTIQQITDLHLKLLENILFLVLLNLILIIIVDYKIVILVFIKMAVE